MNSNDIDPGFWRLHPAERAEVEAARSEMEERQYQERIALEQRIKDMIAEETRPEVRAAPDYAILEQLSPRQKAIMGLIVGGLAIFGLLSFLR